MKFMIGYVYKVIANVLSKRMRPILDKIIYERYCAFIGGRHLLNGSFFVNQVLDDAKIRRKGLCCSR